MFGVRAGLSTHRTGKGQRMTLNINLTPQLEAMVRAKVASGLYGSASELVREALRLMQEHDRLRAAKLEELRQDIREGLESGTATSWDIEEAKREGRRRRARRVQVGAGT
jgi:antitoxin ParD1/3/4